MASDLPTGGNLTPITPHASIKHDSQPHTPVLLTSIDTLDNVGSEEDEEEEFIPSPTDKHPRRSFYYSSHVRNDDPERQQLLNELDRVELSITQNLQKIHHNLSKANAIILDTLVPTLDDFKVNSNKIYRNVNHIKEFYENAANVNILTKDDVIEIHSGTAPTNTANNSIGNISDISINHRYKQNFSSSDILSPSITQHDLDQFSSINFSTLNGFNDESTAKTPVRIVSKEEYKKSLTTSGDISIGAEDDVNIEAELINQENGEVEREAEEDSELSPESKRNRYMSDLVKGYESPPWEEPPKLESEMFISPLKKKRRITVSPHKVNDPNESNDDDISIRFPMSPKYGGGGKLLRSEEGRKIALDFARSEMMANHPILSLQATPSKKDLDPTITETFYTMESNSTIDIPPQLTVPLENPQMPESDDVIDRSVDTDSPNGGFPSEISHSEPENSHESHGAHPRTPTV